MANPIRRDPQTLVNIIVRGLRRLERDQVPTMGGVDDCETTLVLLEGLDQISTELHGYVIGNHPYAKVWLLLDQLGRVHRVVLNALRPTEIARPSWRGSRRCSLREQWLRC